MKVSAMKHFPLTALTHLLLLLGLPLFATPALAEDINSILARRAESPLPDTVAYSYKLTVDIKERYGKMRVEGEIVLRVDPSQPPGSRSNVLFTNIDDSLYLAKYLQKFESPEITTSNLAEAFWCGPGDRQSQSYLDPENFTVLSENLTEADLEPKPEKLAALVLKSYGDTFEDGDQAMKRLADRIEGRINVSKPSGEIKRYSVRIKRPLKTEDGSKLKVMRVKQFCVPAPNGHFRVETYGINIQGRAMDTRFSRKIEMRFSDLTPLPMAK